MFDGALGDWDTDPTTFQLNIDSKFFNCKYYPVPGIDKETFHKELEHLLVIGVLTTVHQSQCGTPIFIVAKKEETVRFITDYRSINQKLVRKPYPLPRIGKKIQQL